MEWIENDELLIYGNKLIINNNKIASFDLDWTLIKTKSCKKLPTDDNDWILCYDNILEKLEELISENYQIIIFTNQSKLKNKDKIPLFKEKIENISKILPKNIQFYISKTHGYYRKPLTGMWDKMLEINKITVVNSSSFYCGDAAGRVDGWIEGKKKDFSCSDRMFANNIGILFYEPEQLFLNKEQTDKWKMEKVDISKYKTNIIEYNIQNKEQELLICVGYPASGKSSFCKQYLEKYKIINQDTLKYKNKCLKLCFEYLQKGDSVVIDNTNPNIDSRKVYLDIARKLNINVRCLLFTCNEQTANHMNYFRCQNSKGDKKFIPIIIY